MVIGVTISKEQNNPGKYFSLTYGAIHKGRPQRGRGSSIADKCGQGGRGGSRQSGRPQQKKIIFNYLIVASLNEVLNRN